MLRKPAPDRGEAKQAQSTQVHQFEAEPIPQLSHNEYGDGQSCKVGYYDPLDLVKCNRELYRERR